MLRILVITLVGAGLGALLGSTRSCADGGCPLTATPLRGALYGAVMAFVIGYAAGGIGGGKMPAESSDRVLHLNSLEDIQREVSESPVPVVVDFYADWCGPCQRLSPIVSELAETYGDRVRVIKVNVDKAAEAGPHYGVQTIPDVRIYRNGEQVKRLSGLQSMKNLEKALGLPPAQ